MPVRKMSYKERDALFGAGLVLFGCSRPKNKQDAFIKDNSVDHKYLGDFNDEQVQTTRRAGEFNHELQHGTLTITRN